MRSIDRKLRYFTNHQDRNQWVSGSCQTLHPSGVLSEQFPLKNDLIFISEWRHNHFPWQWSILFPTCWQSYLLESISPSFEQQVRTIIVTTWSSFQCACELFSLTMTSSSFQYTDRTMLLDKNILISKLYKKTNNKETCKASHRIQKNNQILCPTAFISESWIHTVPDC